MQTIRGYSLGAVDYILSPVRARGAALEGEGLRRPAPDAAPPAAHGRRARRARAGRSGARGRRGEHAALEFPVAREPRAERLARRRDRGAPACSRCWCRSSARRRRSRCSTSDGEVGLVSAPSARTVTRQRRLGWRQPTGGRRCATSTRCARRSPARRRCRSPTASTVTRRAAAASPARRRARRPARASAARRCRLGQHRTSWSSRAAIALENARLYRSVQVEIEERRGVEARAAGVEPAQGRVPRDAVARAAQPARADPHRARGRAPARRPTSRS